jgi:hypothetical protein
MQEDHLRAETLEAALLGPQAVLVELPANRQSRQTTAAKLWPS